MTSPECVKRLQREYKLLVRDPPPNVLARPLASNLLDWHYVLTGGLLLHTSAYGVEAMHGRYAFLQDTNAFCFEVILRLRRLLGFLRIEPKALLALPDRDSAIYAEAAAKVLADAKAPMRAIDLYAEIEKRGLWKTFGKTPEATIYAAMIREIAAKKKESRFRKTERGLFVAAH